MGLHHARYRFIFTGGTVMQIVAQSKGDIIGYMNMEQVGSDENSGLDTYTVKMEGQYYGKIEAHYLDPWYTIAQKALQLIAKIRGDS